MTLKPQPFGFGGEALDVEKRSLSSINGRAKYPQRAQEPSQLSCSTCSPASVLPGWQGSESITSTSRNAAVL